MDKASKQIIQGLVNELALERQLADQLADALINGGMDRQFQAITFHEHTRNGFMYPGVKAGYSPESKPKRQAKRGKRSPTHPTIGEIWMKENPFIHPDWRLVNPNIDLFFKPFKQDDQDKDKEV